MKKPEISIVIPVYEEQDNVVLLYQKNKEILDQLKKEYEIIFIDDGSKDLTGKRLSEIKDKRLKIIKFRRNFGQTAAMDAGIKQAQGDIIITMDGDLQNDPRDIPRLLNKLNQGYDVVSGWRYPRKDPLTKHLSSRLADKVRRFITKEKIHDSGCSLKAYKKECFNNLNLHGEMHRFIPAILLWKGFKIGEIKVRHHPRHSGRTKYNVKRILKGFLDLLVLKFWFQYSTRPIHLFGTTGIGISALGSLFLAYLAIIKYFFHQSADRPLLQLSILLMILGIQFIFFGIITDVLIKLYYKEQTPYSIEKVVEQ
tara:strand:- start:5623 stop:6555 length:933 start_codon:yes stop_codon:yes gene_type:complete